MTILIGFGGPCGTPVWDNLGLFSGSDFGADFGMDFKALRWHGGALPEAGGGGGASPQVRTYEQDISHAWRSPFGLARRIEQPSAGHRRARPRGL